VQLSEIRAEVAANGFDPVQFGAARLTSYINDGYQFICTSVNFTGDESVQDFTTTAGTATYPQPTDVSDIRSLRDTSRRLELRALTLRQLDRGPASQGPPSCYAQSGQSFVLWPTPDGPYPLELRYWKIPAALVADTDVPTVIPANWHWLLWSWAIAQAFRAEDDVQRAQSWDARFTQGLAAFSASVKFTSDMPTRAASMWGEPRLGRRW
jgi:hypothetical protein